MLMPKRVKWRKQMRGRMRGKALRGAEVAFGEFGLQALEPGWVTARQIEAARRSIVREMKRRGKIYALEPAEKYGTSTRAILRELGHADEEIEAMISAGIVSESWSREYLPT